MRVERDFVNLELTNRRDRKPFNGYVSIDDFDGECDDGDAEYTATKAKL